MLCSIAGTAAPLIAPRSFIPSQHPPSQLSPQQLAEKYPLLHTEHVLALQVSNLYFLLMMLGVGILNTTTEPRVVHVYVVALAVADIGHLAASGWFMGLTGLLDVGSWSATMWGNIGITLALFVVRVGYLSGMLGEDNRFDKQIRKKQSARKSS